MRLRYLLLILMLLIVGLGYLLSQPRWLFRIASQLHPGAIYHVDERNSPENKLLPPINPTVALTIDDGPGPNTEKILALLKRHKAKATFFNVSEHLPGYESVVAQAVEAGHELGNHLTKDEPSIRLSASEFETDLLAAEAALLPFIGESAEPRWLRPGMGLYNADMVATAQKHNYRIALGNNFPYDTHIRSARFARSFILNTVQPGDIIVLHDGQRENTDRGDRTLQTLQTVLPALKIRGYTVTTLSELAAGTE